MACAQGGQNSYAEVTVTSGSLKVAYKDENGNTVKDVNGAPTAGHPALSASAYRTESPGPGHE